MVRPLLSLEAPTTGGRSDEALHADPGLDPLGPRDRAGRREDRRPRLHRDRLVRDAPALPRGHDGLRGAQAGPAGQGPSGVQLPARADQPPAEAIGRRLDRGASARAQAPLRWTGGAGWLMPTGALASNGLQSPSSLPISRTAGSTSCPSSRMQVVVSWLLTKPSLAQSPRMDGRVSSRRRRNLGSTVFGVPAMICWSRIWSSKLAARGFEPRPTAY